MKKLWVGLAALFTVVVLVGCGKHVDATGSKDGVYLYKIEGKADAKKIYWKSGADGESSVKVKKGKYSLTNLQRRKEKYDIKVSDNSDFKNAATISVPSIKPLGSVDAIEADYEDAVASLDTDSSPDFTNLGNEGFSTVSDDSGVKISASVEDGKLLGMSFDCDLQSADYDSDSSTQYLTAGVFGVGHALGANSSVLEKLFTRATKGNGQSITLTSNKVEYTCTAIKNVMIIINIAAK